jgi:glutamate--cysteine ligase
MKNQILEISQTEKTPIIVQIKKLLHDRSGEVNDWFKKISKNTPPFFYNSVDLRHSGFKLTPVDTNLFPAGFNNLNEYERKNAVKHVQEFFGSYYADVKKILIITEDHTRNTYYLENVGILSTIIKNAGFEVVLSSIGTYESGQGADFTTPSGIALQMQALVKKDGIISTKNGFTPDFILLNNDMTGGAPELFTGVKQPISPPVEFGWHKRRKTSHFETYNNMARDFAHVFEIDPWLISTYFARCGAVNFKEKFGLECVAAQVDKIILQISGKYKEYGIEDAPYVFIKSDMGTYGMGIMTARSGAEVLDIGKDIRKKMDVIKGGAHNTEVIIQEGVPTIDKVGENTAEPMIYLVGGESVGCIYRTNTQRNEFENLNASGMAFSSICNESNDKELCGALGLIAKLAAYSAAWECYVESYAI